MTANEILSLRDHRPIPFSDKPWVMRQEWHELMFIHWAVDPERLRSLIPAELTLDLWHGQAYVAVTPFVLRGLRPRGAPSFPLISHFPEVNVRTYVIFRDIPGVYFFSLDAANLSAVVAARLLYGLPYYRARMKVGHINGQIVYSSQRLPNPGPTANVELQVRYAPSSNLLPWKSPSESVERFLTERYCLYSVVGRCIYRAHIHHTPWPLQTAIADIQKNTMLAQIHISSDSSPICHFAKYLEVLIWWPERVA